MPSLNVLIHFSADYYKYYVVGFFKTNFKNVNIYYETDIPPDTYVHCLVVYKPTLDEIRKYLKPYTKVVCFSGDPHDVKLEFVHLIIDCKQEPSMRKINVAFAYLPFYVQSFAERLAHPRDLVLRADFDADAIAKQKTKFCAFMYSNPVDFRDRFFHTMARVYKSADALGSCCSNTPIPETTRTVYDPQVKTFYEDAVEKYQPYKFVIAIENSRLKGYVTEKLMNPVLAHAVPIYLGAPDLFTDNIFNRKAMIHIADFASYEDCVNYVKKVDNNPDLYQQYLREPLFVKNQLPAYFNANYLVSTFLQLFHQ